MKFPITPETRVTYISMLKNVRWPQWKIYKDLNDEEKQQFNLASWPKNYILMDRDLPDRKKEEREDDYLGFKTMLVKRGISKFMSWNSPKGYHVLIKFKNLDKQEDDIRKEVAKFYINLFDCDLAKVSNFGIVAVDERPHFKNEGVYTIIDDFEGENDIPDSVLQDAKIRVEENRNKLIKINKDTDFIHYFEKDAFFQYIKNNIIPENSGRDITIFPNLAIAASKSGKTLEEIKEIINPIIKNNFPGKKYIEFEGWLKKALNNEITDYNPFQLNSWMRIYSKDKKDIYDLNPVKVELLEDEKKEKFIVYWDKDLDNIEDLKNEWLVDGWLSKGDINFIAGKAASLKTTTTLHIAYCVSEGLPVFNKYPTIKTKVLYLNEENSSKLFLKTIQRVKKGLGLEDKKTDNICFAFLQNIKLDRVDDLKWLIKFCIDNNIGYIVCDSFRRFVSFDENSANEMNGLFNNLKQLRKLTNEITLSIIHHTKKDSGNYTQDNKDSLRGSSDIVNAADSIISIKRKAACSAIQIEHIKNRAGEEMTNKLILISSGETKDMAYFYESDKEMDSDKVVSIIEKCAEEIIACIKRKNLQNGFRKKDIESNFSDSTFNRAFSILQKDGTITGFGSTKDKQYILNEENLEESREEVEEEPTIEVDENSA